MDTGILEDSASDVTMSVPLLIRLLEYAREDAKSDEDLHKVVEHAIEKGGTLSMENYGKLVKTKDAHDAGAFDPQKHPHQGAGLSGGQFQSTAGQQPEGGAAEQVIQPPPMEQPETEFGSENPLFVAALARHEAVKTHVAQVETQAGHDRGRAEQERRREEKRRGESKRERGEGEGRGSS